MLICRSVRPLQSDNLRIFIGRIDFLTPCLCELEFTNTKRIIIIGPAIGVQRVIDPDLCM